MGRDQNNHIYPWKWLWVSLYCLLVSGGEPRSLCRQNYKGRHQINLRWDPSYWNVSWSILQLKLFPLWARHPILWDALNVDQQEEREEKIQSWTTNFIFYIVDRLKIYVSTELNQNWWKWGIGLKTSRTCHLNFKPINFMIFYSPLKLDLVLGSTLIFKSSLY